MTGPAIDMQNRWRKLAVKAFKWVGAPIFVGLLGFYIVGPLIGGPKPNPQPVNRPPASEVLATTEPFEPEEWTMPSPPQVDILVELSEDDSLGQFGRSGEGRPVPPPIEISDDGDVDEAGLGGFVRRPPKQPDKNLTWPLRSGDEAGAGGITRPPVKKRDG